MKDILYSLLAPNPIINATLIDGVTMIGDSIGNQVAELLPVINYCQPGDRAHDAWIRFPYEHRIGNILVIQHGTNDIKDPVKYLRKMAEYAYEEGREVVLTGISRKSFVDVEDINERIEDLAERLGAPFADWGSVPIFCPDGLHPDLDSAQKLAEVTLRAIGKVSTL